MKTKLSLSQANDLASGYITGAKVKEDLAKLMEFEEIDTLVYRVYTPSFNDGDLCEFTISFIGPPFCVYEDEQFPVVVGENLIVHHFYDEIDEEHLSLVPQEKKAILDEIISLSNHQQYGSIDYRKKMYELEELLQPSYKTQNLQKALQYIAEIILETNTEGFIRLIDGKIEIVTSDYDCEY